MEMGKANAAVGQPIQPATDSFEASMEYAVTPRGSGSPAGHGVVFLKAERRVRERALEKRALERREMREAEEKGVWEERKPTGLDRLGRDHDERYLRGTEGPVIPDYVMRVFGPEEEEKEGRDNGIRT